MEGLTRFTKPSVLLDRSDIDPHQNIRQDDLGEHLGDGFFLNYEPVKIDRDPATGRIIRTTPLSEWQRDQERIREVTADLIEEGEPVPQPTLRPRSERAELVNVIAARMFRYFEEQLVTQPKRPNPLRDGIPTYRDGTWVLEVDPSRSADMTRLVVPRGTVYEWIQALVGARAKRVNESRGW